MRTIARMAWESLIEIIVWAVVIFTCFLLCTPALGGNAAAVTKWPCDIVVDVDHYTPWGENERHRIFGWFFEPMDGWHEIQCRHLSLHSMSSREVLEGVRVASRARVVGYWMDRKRSVILPMRIEVIEGRTDIKK